MVRTRDPIAHAASRSAFVDAALSLLRAKGWAAISTEEILRTTGASKGALYHYFRSKQSLLEAVVDQMADQVVEQMEAAIDGSRDDPATRLSSVFEALGRWKVDRLDVLAPVLRAWQSEANAPARERLRAVMATRIAPLVARCLQPVQSDEPSEATVELGRVLVAMVQALNDRLADLLLDQQDIRQSRAEGRRAVTTVTRAIETVLHLDAGSLTLATPDQLDRIFPDETSDPRPAPENHDPNEDR